MTDQTQITDQIAQADERMRSTETILRDLGQAMVEVERERRRVRPEDWATLFRQMRDVLQQLLTHPFIAGDAHAEMLATRMLAASDMVEFDTRLDRFGEYIAGKLAYNAALAAIREGREPDPASLIPRKFGASAPGAGRVVGRHGPSGSDFEIAGGGETVQPRRGILRL